MKKKIGIITILNVNNYGAELQAFALQSKLKEIGFDSEIINYLYYKNPKFKNTKKSKPFVKLSISNKIKEFLYPWISLIKSLPYYNKKKNRDLKFSNFHEEFTNLSKVYRSIDELYAANLDYDAYIVGSDQVWNPFTNVNIEPYFLTFAPESKLKLSYASSFGVAKIDEVFKKHYRQLLNNLDYIGVREENGVSIVEDITDRNDAEWVLDPTLLLRAREWEKYSIKPNISEPYLLLYVLSDSQYIKNLAKQISEELNLKVVRICKTTAVEDNTPGVLNVIDAGPKEFLGLFLNSSFVLTTSFHGTCFSLNFEKPFYSILKESKINNSRIESILNYMNLKDRILYTSGGYPEKNNYLFNSEESIEKRNEKVETSLNYLKKILNKK